MNTTSAAGVAFKLRGHSCIYGVYPSPVIPVGLLGRSLVAVYPGGQHGPTIEQVNRSSKFVRHAPRVAGSLAGFDFREHRLFAYEPTRVVYYPVSDEADFLEAFLSREQEFGVPSPIRGILTKYLQNLKHRRELTALQLRPAG